MQHPTPAAPFRKIIHVDMDCFYAAVEVKHNSDLRGLPLGIGGPPNTRSVLCTASYEARKFGVRSAMPSSQAVGRCPQLVLLPPNFPLYKKESLAVREIFSRFSGRIEPLSLDEAFLDVTDSPFFDGSATRIAQEIRRLIAEELKLPASAGVAPNKFLAKIGSDWRKPNGLFVIRPQDVAGFVRELPVEKIHGVGAVTARKMHGLGLLSCADIQRQSTGQLTEWFGSRGEELARIARGQDDRPVDSSSGRKSLSVEETFPKDLSTLDDCLRTLPGIYEDWERRMRKGGYFERLRGFAVKVKFFDFHGTTHETRSNSIPGLDDFATLLRNVWAKRAAPVRLLGLGARLACDEDEDDGMPRQLKLAI